MSTTTDGEPAHLSSVNELEPELNLPRPVRAAGAYRALDNLPERGVVQVVRELAAVRPAAARHPVGVEYIERLHAELEPFRLGNPKRLAQRHIRHRNRLRADVTGPQRGAARRRIVRKLQEVDRRECAARHIYAV